MDFVDPQNPETNFALQVLIPWCFHHVHIINTIHYSSVFGAFSVHHTKKDSIFIKESRWVPNVWWNYWKNSTSNAKKIMSRSNLSCCQWPFTLLHFHLLTFITAVVEPSPLHLLCSCLTRWMIQHPLTTIPLFTRFEFFTPFLQESGLWFVSI